MKILRPGLGVAVLLAAMHTHLSAQILTIHPFKVTVYAQTSASPPTAPNYPDAYYFGAELNADPSKSLEYSLPMVFTPSVENNEFVMNGDGPFYYVFNSPYYACKTNLDTDYPPGVYNYNVNYLTLSNTPATDNVLVLFQTNELYSATIPAFTADCWTAMQNVDPSADLTVAWNNYTETPGAAYAYTFLEVYDSQTQGLVYNFSTPPGASSTIIPGGLLEYGHTYTLDLFFSNRVTPPATNEDGSAVSMIVGFDNLTMASLTVMAPWLQIARAGSGCVTLTWPSLATNYELQASHQLGPCADWCQVTNPPTVMGSTNSLTLPAHHPHTFFRLAPM